MTDRSERHRTVSAYIITKNEEKNIKRAVESVRWMDEVIVLDSGSTDRTRETAETLGAKVAVREFDGFVTQKNAAMDMCSGDWVFNLDADEEVTPELRKSIEQVVNSDAHTTRADVCMVARKTWYMGRWIKHCGWYPEYRARLSKKGSARWQGEILHERLQGSGTTEMLSGDLLHRPYSDLGEHIGTIRRYSELWARREFEAGHASSWINLLLRPCARFVKMYVLRLGFLDGGAGFVASVMGAWYTFMKYARLHELSKVSE